MKKVQTIPTGGLLPMLREYLKIFIYKYEKKN